MDRVRFGVVGTGGMGRHHCKLLREIEEIELTAVCDADPETAERVGAELGVRSFSSHEELLDAGVVDAVVIATPHWQHPDIAVAAFERGVHVMCEKPLAVTASGADRMIEAQRRSGCRFGVMFQWRTDPVYRRARQLVRSGAIGELYRTLTISSHFRSQAYYDSGSWRATWEGEGGGVLLNQAPHNLDIFTWIGGMPSSVSARCETRMHRIEVEDVASAMLRYPNGAHGYIHTSTVEHPGTDLMEFCGDLGKITISGGRLRLARIPGGIRSFSDTTDRMFGGIRSEWEEVACDPRPTGHREIHRNFAAAILHGEPLYAPGHDSAGSVELANAMILSSARNREIPLPLPRREYDRFIQDRIEEARSRRG